MSNITQPGLPAQTHALVPLLLQAKPKPLEIDLQKTAVIVIDMQNAFLRKGGFIDLVGRLDISRAEKIIGPVKEIVSAARAKGVKVIYTRGVFLPDLLESEGQDQPRWHKPSMILYREHPEWADRFLCTGTWGAEIIEQLKPSEGDIVIDKPGYSAFYNTDLDAILKTYDIKYLVFVGATTNCCVSSSIRDAFERTYFVILVSDAAMHSGPDFAQDAVILDVIALFGWVTTSNNIVKAME